jgi:hypothetical protein
VKFTDYIKYLLENPQAAKMLGLIVLSIVAAPIIISWFRGGQMRKAIKTYHDIINDLTGQVSDVYENVSKLQKDLSKTQGALAVANAKLVELESEVQSAHEVSFANKMK